MRSCSSIRPMLVGTDRSSVALGGRVLQPDSSAASATFAASRDMAMAAIRASGLGPALRPGPAGAVERVSSIVSSSLLPLNSIVPMRCDASISIADEQLVSAHLLAANLNIDPKEI